MQKNNFKRSKHYFNLTLHEFEFFNVNSNYFARVLNCSDIFIFASDGVADRETDSCRLLVQITKSRINTRITAS